MRVPIKVIMSITIESFKIWAVLVKYQVCYNSEHFLRSNFADLKFKHGKQFAKKDIKLELELYATFLQLDTTFCMPVAI